MSNGAKTVLFVSGDLPVGGAAIFVLNICDGLKQIHSPWRGVAGVFSELGEIGTQMRSRDLPITNPIMGRLIHEDYIEAFFRECQQLKPTVVVANLGGNAYDFLRFVPKTVLRVAVIHSDNDCVYKQVETYLPWIDLIIGVSARNCAVMRERLRVHNTPVKQVACGVPMPQPFSREIRQHGALRILFLGRVIEEAKRASVLAQVIQKTIALGLQVSWTIAGDGPELPSLRLIFANNGDQIQFLGEIPYTEIPAVLTKHDVFFLCSDFEGLPLSLLEAMGAGCVPVVSDLPSGISEVVDEENGIRVPVTDINGYVSALAELCGDRRRLADMSVAATRAVLKDYSTEAMARRWTNVLDEYAKESPADWSQPCVADAPPSCREHWYFNRRLRIFRKAIKLIRS